MWKSKNNFGLTYYLQGVADAKVKVMFAPYEADSQLAKLCHDGIADAVVTEDSDLLVYR